MFRKTPRRSASWGKLVFVYILQLFSYATAAAVTVQLIAPRYVRHRGAATLLCNHSVPENELYKIEFLKDNNNKILQYIKERTPPFKEGTVDAASMEYSQNGTTIKLKDVGFKASGSYSCAVSTDNPLYTKVSENVRMEVIVPQADNPHITFKKSAYTIGEYLEANCTSSPARPIPHLTWFINGREVDVALVHHYPYVHHKNGLKSAIAKLRIEVGELHAGKNGDLEISCHSTIPVYPIHHKEYADFRKKTVSVQIKPAPSSARSVAPGLALTAIIPCVARAILKIIP